MTPVRTAIRPGRVDEADELRDLAHRSKAYWPYREEFLEAVRPLLQLSAADMRSATVRVLEIDGRRAGWHRVTLHPDHAELEDLWLEPEWIGKGLGRVLFDDAVGIARHAGATRLEWDAEPFAEGFYRTMGGEEIGRSPSAVEQNRTLPRMRLELTPSR